MPASPQRRQAPAVLCIGTALSVAALFGPDWVIRIGVATAVVAAILGCALAWRELRQAHRENARKLLAASRSHGQQLSAERAQHGSVLEEMSARVQAADQVAATQRVTIGELRVQISSLRGDAASLRGEINHRDAVISSLRSTVQAREAEIAALRTDGGEEAKVHAWPRRASLDETAMPESAETDVWGDASHPTVVDLAMLDVVLPNYEPQRRRA